VSPREALAGLDPADRAEALAILDGFRSEVRALLARLFIRLILLPREPSVGAIVGLRLVLADVGGAS
jgi:hypothetical protein